MFHFLHRFPLTQKRSPAACSPFWCIILLTILLHGKAFSQSSPATNAELLSQIASIKNDIKSLEKQIAFTDSMKSVEAELFKKSQSRFQGDMKSRKKELQDLKNSLNKTASKVRSVNNDIAQSEMKIESIKAQQSQIRETLAKGCEKLMQSISQSLDWKRTERSNRVQSLLQDLKTKNASLEEGLSRLSNLYQEAIEFGDKVEYTEEPVIRTNGDVVNGKVIRIGNQALAYMGDEEKNFGILFPTKPGKKSNSTEINYEWKETFTFQERNMIRKAIDVKSAKKPPQLITLPYQPIIDAHPEPTTPSMTGAKKMRRLNLSVILSLKLFLVLLIVNHSLYSKEKPEEKIRKQLEKELAALTDLKIKKQNQLEKTEALRWQERYQQHRETEQFDQNLKKLETQYNRLATQKGNLEEKLIQTISLQSDIKEKFENQKLEMMRYQLALDQQIKSVSNRLNQDFPSEMSRRLALLNKAAQLIDKEQPDHINATTYWMQERLLRHTLTISSETKTVGAFFKDEKEVPAWQYRIGTIFMGELQKEAPYQSQILLRTGSLQGKTFVWKGDLPENDSKNLSAMIQNASNKAPLNKVLLDVLQNKNLSQGSNINQQKTFIGRASETFNAGGIVMYPLIAAALIALFMSLERFIVLTYRGSTGNQLARKVDKLALQSNYQVAMRKCEKSKASVSKVLLAVLKNKDQKRQTAEKAAREAMLREIPELEKRLSLLAALGAAAPLMGLLGTVSGMITLFKVITDVGTNDPKILAGGISEALVTTQTGLIIAIPILLIHGYLGERLDRIRNSMTGYSLKLLNHIWPED